MDTSGGDRNELSSVKGWNERCQFDAGVCGDWGRSAEARSESRGRRMCATHDIYSSVQISRGRPALASGARRRARPDAVH